MTSCLASCQHQERLLHQDHRTRANDTINDKSLIHLER